MSLKVIGAGFGRTGTLSMKLALEQLGLGPCHHMMEVFGKPDHIALWQAAAEGKASDWDAVFAAYESAVDWPVCHFWQELSEVYPDAKFILTKRDADAWYDSASETIFRGMMNSDTSDPHRQMVKTLIAENTFSGKLTDRDHAIAVFNQHNQKVIDSLAPDRLLVFEASQGWAPLCEFLGLAIPDSPYPRVNSKDDFKKKFKM